MDEEEQKRHNVHVQSPRGFNADKPGMVLKLDKNLCGSKSAPRKWFKLSKENLEAVGFEQQVESPHHSESNVPHE